MSDETKTPELDLERALQSRGASRSWIEPVLAKVAAIEARHADELNLVRAGAKLLSDGLDDWEAEASKLRAELVELRSWKASAMEVDSQWEPMRRFARLRGARLGHSLAEESARIANELESENKTLRAKMATMVCGTCKGAGGEKSGKDNGIEWTSWTYCPVCQPAKEGE